MFKFNIFNVNACHRKGKGVRRKNYLVSDSFNCKNIQSLGLQKHLYYLVSKCGLTSEGILILVPLPTKGAKSLLRRKFEFPSKTVNNLLFKFSAQESNLAPFVGDGNKVKIPSEIKPLLEGIKY